MLKGRLSGNSQEVLCITYLTVSKTAAAVYHWVLNVFFNFSCDLRVAECVTRIENIWKMVDKGSWFTS